MDLLNLTTAALFVVGTIFVVTALLKFKRQNQAEADRIFAEQEKAVENLQKQISENMSGIETFKEQINSRTDEIFKQLDDKYQEILFLYSLIDNKKQELADYYSKTPETKAETPRTRVVSKKHKEIIDHYSNGESCADIAKKLNIGQGEVRLVLELEKVRVPG